MATKKDIEKLKKAYLVAEKAYREVYYGTNIDFKTWSDARRAYHKVEDEYVSAEIAYSNRKPAKKG